jgi:hypothetical protein
MRPFFVLARIDALCVPFTLSEHTVQKWTRPVDVVGFQCPEVQLVVVFGRAIATILSKSSYGQGIIQIVS